MSTAERRRIRQVLWAPEADVLLERGVTAELTPELIA